MSYRWHPNAQDSERLIACKRSAFTL